jgi:large subunit ribosomal protein L21
MEQIIPIFAAQSKFSESMFAIVDISGRQMKLEPGRFVYVNRMNHAEGEEVVLDKVMLVENDGTTRIGKPYVAGATVKATVLSHLRDDKVIVFKKKRRKGYKKRNGHRQDLTKLQISAIIG